jgi:anti-sigma B factor antagonist
MEQLFEVSVDVADEVPVVRVRGEIDVATAPALRECLRSIDLSSGTRIVVDLLGVTFLDSTALGALVGALRRSREAGGDFRLVIAEPRILRVFEITGLTDVFTITASVDAAVKG